MTGISRALIVVVALCAGGAAASAQSAKADALFKKGKKLLDEAKYDEACAAFEASQRAEPTVGTQLNIARCYEQWGKLATAYASYEEALHQAQDSKDDRVARITERIAAIEPTVPTLVIHANGKPVDLMVKFDGKDLALGELDSPKKLDPGDHVVEYGVGTSAKKRTTVTLGPGDHKDVTLEDLASMQVGGPVEETLGPDQPKVERPPPVTHVGRGRRIGGLVIGSTGLVTIGISSYLVLAARSDYRAAKEAHCNDMSECDPVGLKETHAARHRANIGTVVFAVGLAAVAGGVVVYLTAPHGNRQDGPVRRKDRKEHALRLMPVVTPDGAAVVLGGEL